MRAAAIVVIALAGLVVWAAPGTTGARPDRGPSAAAKNHPPYFPTPTKSTQSTRFVYDDTGNLMDAITTIRLITKPIDTDHDRLTYVWKASNGKIRGNGLTAVWSRACCEDDGPAPGTVTLIVTDGHGGKATAKFVFY